MSADLPTSSKANQTGRHGVTLLQACFEKEGWIFRRQDGDSDFGIDGEIEIVDSNNVTGRIAKCQVKSSPTVVFNDGETSVSVKATTYNLWKVTPLITILFYVDTRSGGVYWTPALAHHPKSGAASLSVRFEEANDLRSGLKSLRAYLDSWFAVRGGEAITHEIPPFHHIYNDLCSDIDHYDDWCEMGEEEDGRFRLFYRHVLRLRLEVGLSNGDLPSLDDWYIRNVGLWNGDDFLCWGTYREAMKLIKLAYEEALAKITARLAVAKITIENQYLWNFLDRLNNNGHIQRGLIDGRASDPRFHSALEAKLQAVDALTYQFSDRKV